ncbi:MAG: hypothetical protein UHD05_00010 [Ruminococcus sp.]|nr:hypothetical protein [Ruminococcus sp.]
MKILTKRNVIITIVILLVILLTLRYCSLPLKQDSDMDYHTSSKGYMTFCNGELTSLIPFQNSTDVYKDGRYNFGDPISVNYKNYRIEVPDKDLIIKDKNDDTEKILSHNIKRYVVSDDKIVYSEEESSILYVYSIAEDTTQKIEIDNQGELDWFDVKNGTIYIIYIDNIMEVEELFPVDTPIYNLTDRIVHVYKYNLNLLEKEESADFHLLDELGYYICNDSVYIICYSGVAHKLYTVDFENNCIELLFERAFTENIVCNDRYIFYSVHDYDMTIYKQTVDNEANGIWKYDTQSRTCEKISDDCVIDDLLVTDNYLYCYKINTIFPYGMFDEINLGYKIIQIPIE